MTILMTNKLSLSNRLRLINYKKVKICKNSKKNMADYIVFRKNLTQQIIPNNLFVYLNTNGTKVISIINFFPVFACY